MSNCKKILILLFLIAFVCCPVFAASGDKDDVDDYVGMYGLGDQMFSINAGLFIPLFFFDRSVKVMDTNLTLGGEGSLAWQVYISNHWSIGGEFGGMFAFSPNERILYMVPLIARATYWLRLYPFEFPISMGLGGCLSVLKDSAHIDFIAKPSIGVLWNFNDEWAFGAYANYWFIPQIYSGSGKVSSDQTMFGNFMDVSLSVLFRF